MADKLSNLLSAEPATDLAPTGRAASADRGMSRPHDAAGGRTGRDQKADRAGRRQITRGVPVEVMRQLDLALRQQLGSRYALLGHLLHPLRHAIEQVQQVGVAGSVHPLTRAASDGVPQLIDRIDDAVTAMLRVQQPRRAATGAPVVAAAEFPIDTLGGPVGTAGWPAPPVSAA